ncbi:MAG: DUF998 domain-containing protein [Methanomethylophilus sp.]|jgi:hypothetical membrane protein
MNADAKRHAAAFGWIGIIAGVMFCLTWLACYSADSSWVWGTNSFSDFGISDTDAATYFEWGCIITSILLAVYGIGEALNSKKVGFISCGIILVFTGLSLVMVGFYDADYEGGDIHDFFAVLGATLFVFASLFWTGQCWYDGKILAAGAPVVLYMISFFSYVSFEWEEWEVISLVLAAFWLIEAATYTVARNVQPKNPVDAVARNKKKEVSQ